MVYKNISVKQELEYYCFLKGSLLDCLSYRHKYYVPTVLPLGMKNSISTVSYGYEHIYIVYVNF